MRKLAIVSSLAALVGATAFAHAENVIQTCGTKAEKDYLTIDGLRTKMIEYGYKIRGMRIKEACGELSAIDRNGKDATLFVDLTSGGSAREDD